MKQSLPTYDIEAFRQRLIASSYTADQVVYDDDFVAMDDISPVEISRQPARYDMAIIGLCLRGEGDVFIDGTRIHISPNCYLILHPDQVAQWADTATHVQGIFICLSSRIYNEVLQRMQKLLPLFFYIRRHPCAPLNVEDTAWIKNYHRAIFTELGRCENIFRLETARALMVAMLFRVCNLYSSALIGEQPVNNRQEEIFTQFLSMVSEQYNRHHDVTWYADRQCITPKYLSSVVKHISGKPANDWIETYVVQEAKNQLVSTHRSVQQIAFDLGFTSQSFFGKYFKRVTGVSPQQFRRRIIASERDTPLTTF